MDDGAGSDDEAAAAQYKRVIDEYPDSSYCKKAEMARVELAMGGATGTVWFDDVRFGCTYGTNARLLPLSRGSIYATMYPELGIYQAAGPPAIDAR